MTITKQQAEQMAQECGMSEELKAMRELGQWSTEIESLTAQLAEAQARIKELEEENSNYADQVDAAVEDYNNALKQISDLTAQLEAAKVQGEPEKENHKESEGIMVATQGMHGPEEIIDGTLQDRVQPWMMACFGPEIAADKLERGDRFIEEALELLQSGDYPKERVYSLVEYVYGRPKGEPFQEVGGVMITLAAYCLAYDLDMHEAGETELARIWTKVEQIRAKQAAKPQVNLIHDLMVVGL